MTKLLRATNEQTDILLLLDWLVDSSFDIAPVSKVGLGVSTDAEGTLMLSQHTIAIDIYIYIYI